MTPTKCQPDDAMPMRCVEAFQQVLTHQAAMSAKLDAIHADAAGAIRHINALYERTNATKTDLAVLDNQVKAMRAGATRWSARLWEVLRLTLAALTGVVCAKLWPDR